MANSSLPINIINFFKRTQSVASSEHVPIWLLSGYDDDTWKVNLGFMVRGGSSPKKEIIKLHWGKNLPAGLLTDPAYKRVLLQARRIVVIAFDGTLPAQRGSLRSIDHFHWFLFRFIEFLDVRYGSNFRTHGFDLVCTEDVVDMLDLTRESGTCGSGSFIERWEFFLDGQSSNGRSDQDARTFLSSIGAMNAEGAVDLRFVGQAIGVDAQRLGRSKDFMNYLSQPTGFAVTGSRRKDKTISGMASWFNGLNQVIAEAPLFGNSELKNPFALTEILKSYSADSTGRTRSMPFRIGSKLISESCIWIVETSPILVEYVRSVFTLAHRMAQGRSSEWMLLKEAEERLPLPQSLSRIGDFLNEKTTRNRKDPNTQPLVLKLMDMQVSVSFVILALFSCSRLSEILNLQDSNILEKRGLFYIKTHLRKTGMDSVRKSFTKPVPELVNNVSKSLVAFREIALILYPGDAPEVQSVLFTRVTNQGLGHYTGPKLYIALSHLSHFIELKDSSDHIWIVLPHQLRRLFALSFFHQEGSENSLPALSWFMGHENLAATWRYVKESLTGREISASEAAMAASAVCSDDASEGASQLRSVLKKHFGCGDLNVMTDEEIQDYLEFLSETGVYTATPVCIRVGDRRKVSVLIKISEINNASPD